MRALRFADIRSACVLLGTAAAILATPWPARPATSPSHNFTILGHAPLDRISFFGLTGDPPLKTSYGTGDLVLENEATLGLVVRRRHNAKKGRSTYTLRGKGTLVGAAYPTTGPTALLKGKIKTSGVGATETVTGARFTYRTKGTDAVKAKVRYAGDVTLASSASGFSLGPGETGIYLSLVLSRQVSEDCSLWAYGLPCDQVVSSNETMVLFRPDTGESGIVWPYANDSPYLRSANGGLFVGMGYSWSAWDLDANDLGESASPYGVNPQFIAMPTGDYFIHSAGTSNNYRTIVVNMVTGESNEPEGYYASGVFGDRGRLFYCNADSDASKLPDTILQEVSPWTLAPMGSALHFDMSAYIRIYREMDGDTVYLLGERGETSEPGRGSALDLYRLSGTTLQPVVTVNLESEILAKFQGASTYTHENAFDIAGSRFIYRAWEEGFILVDFDALTYWIYDVGAEIKDMAIVQRP